MFKFWNKQKREIERLTKLAYYDTLTQLPNRLMFQTDVVEAMSYSLKTNEPLTVFLIDLDNFKHINDTHGHAVGDMVLKQVSYRIEAIKNARCKIAESINKYNFHECKCLAARLGGDEFVIVFEHMDKHEAQIIAMQMLSILKQPSIIEGNEIIISVSLGISIFPSDANNISGLLKAADLAMYTAKENGKDQFSFHESYMNTKVQKRVEIELMIREIINSGKIEINYQPIFNVNKEEITGFEALLRASKSNINFSPTELIKIAEESNLIIPLGTIILEKACQFGCECLDAGFDLSVSVNLSSPQLTADNFEQIVANTLKKTGLPAQNLILEITETILMLNFEKSAATLNRLRELGVKISIDDFGKGYSSFNYLQSLPISKLKIDMSFVQLLGLDKKTNVIVKGIIEMADALGMDTCAEGVETKLQLIKLKEFGCGQAQGHYKYPALSSRQFFEMLDHEVVIKVS